MYPYGSYFLMEQNRFAHDAPPPADPATGLSVPQPAPAAGPPADTAAFATLAEEDAYWAGVCDGIRNAGGTPPPRLAARAARERLLASDGTERLLASDGTERLPAADAPAAPSVLDFDPVPVRSRAGWTPQRQREFVEALADTGIVRAAAARVGMTEQSVNWLRRRADARAFDLACETAFRIGARRIHSIAYERAIEGSVRRHYYHGELKSEERVYDNRLLIALIGKLPDPHQPAPELDAVERSWEPWMDAIEQGLPAPELAPEPAIATPAAEPEAADDGEAEPPRPMEVWEDGGDWLTNCPPPPGFDLFEDGAPGDKFYQRLLSPEEEEYWEETGLDDAREVGGLGGTFYCLDRDTFFPWGYEKAEKSEAADPQEERSAASEACGERSARTADGSAAAEPDRRHGFAGTAPPSQAAEPQVERSEASETCGERQQERPAGPPVQPAEPDRRHGLAGTDPSDPDPPS